ncbi:MAG TPA: Rieske (2Fe-2S) protein [Marmoricola sp.]|nr:Rieske (2Fe-2S) protein [Marmoricola sp.]
MTSLDLTRRVFGGAALLGLSAPVLAACGSDEAATAGSFPVATADVPLGGGVVLADAQLVVTQPAEGEFRCFTAVCTHQGCTVGSVTDGEIACPCHGSRFSAQDGSVVNGPATDPLEEFPVSVKGGQVVRS